jgi:hypothetical protein
MNQLPIDGVIGLSPPQLNSLNSSIINNNHFLRKVFSQNRLDSDIFALNLGSVRKYYFFKIS